MIDTPTMYAELWALRRRKPFVQFTIKLVDGTSLFVDELIHFAFNESAGFVHEKRVGTHAFKLKNIIGIDLHEPQP